ncbi:DUF7009 family protein [Pontibacter pamirensis]|uniref:DUF7009 family protein n=1 Tax=Pontibacter pamirensis TaxID=2562824 RepID=UPI00138A478F|nr:hypothetical protein [Pontibacter pamirensis]
MKIRMSDNSLRLRLMQQEVEQFNREGKVMTATQLGPSPSQILRYSLTKDEGAEVVTATFISNDIEVRVPAKLSEEWAQTDRVGLEDQMPLGEGRHLYILIEKDFKCLQERPREDESDAFPNPLGMKC